FPLIMFLPRPRTPHPPLFPYTTLFRSETRRLVRQPEIVGMDIVVDFASDDHADNARCRLTDRPAQGEPRVGAAGRTRVHDGVELDRKSTRLNSSHVSISYAVFCLKKKN